MSKIIPKERRARAVQKTPTITAALAAGEQLWPPLSTGPRGGHDKRELRAYIHRVDQIRALCAEFGWLTTAYDPGVNFVVDHRHYTMDPKLLLLLIPLLEELVERRANETSSCTLSWFMVTKKSCVHGYTWCCPNGRPEPPKVRKERTCASTSTTKS